MQLLIGAVKQLIHTQDLQREELKSTIKKMLSIIESYYEIKSPTKKEMAFPLNDINKMIKSRKEENNNSIEDKKEEQPVEQQ
jgi:translation elongation factor EF-1beta